MINSARSQNPNGVPSLSPGLRVPALTWVTGIFRVLNPNGVAPFLLLFCLLLTTARAADVPTVLIVVGAPGEEEYGTAFAKAAELWRAAAEKGAATNQVIGLAPTNATTTDRALFTAALTNAPHDGLAPLWIVLVGHGTYDGREAKFNLRGPDFAATELAAWLKPFTRPLAVIDSSSASAPFMAALKGTNRVVITATRSGSEENYARFGTYLAETIADPAADLDKDGQTSLLEAFLMASRRTLEFYTTAGRLATEHPLLDDNGDGLGTPADWFRGIRAIKRARDGATLDGLRAHQFHLVPSPAEAALPPERRRRRDALELTVTQLRDRKAKLPEDDYYRQLEPLMLELSRLSTTTPDGPPK